MYGCYTESRSSNLWESNYDEIGYTNRREVSKVVKFTKYSPKSYPLALGLNLFQREVSEICFARDLGGMICHGLPEVISVEIRC